jgi:tRNA threonylcarbamoyl adenosine modification protein (Sua5/YciO/YrdC/YwlC family)
MARADEPQAVTRMYALKGRDRKPGTVIAASVGQLVELGVDGQYLSRVKQRWPGSLSVEIPLGPELSYLHQGTGRQGFRVVADERVRSLLEKTGPLVTSSANLPGKDPADTIEEAYDYFKDTVDFYVDGGNRSGSKPSTIARVTDEGIEIIRQGVVTIPPEALRKATLPPDDCPFCLSNNDLKADILYQDGDIFITTAASVPGTYLIIPKIHIEEFTDLPDDWWKHIKQALRKLPEVPKAYNISVNYGKPAGQSIKHLHFWIVPRAEGHASSGKGLAGLITAVDRNAAA